LSFSSYPSVWNIPVALAGLLEARLCLCPVPGVNILPNGSLSPVLNLRLRIFCHHDAGQ
jgi:hypothetical protein